MHINRARSAAGQHTLVRAIIIISNSISHATDTSVLILQHFANSVVLSMFFDSVNFDKHHMQLYCSMTIIFCGRCILFFCFMKTFEIEAFRTKEQSKSSEYDDVCKTIHSKELHGSIDCVNAKELVHDSCTSVAYEIFIRHTMHFIPIDFSLENCRFCFVQKSTDWRAMHLFQELLLTISATCWQYQRRVYI